MKTIKIGNKNVPVIGHQDRAGNPGSGDVSSNVISSLGLSNGEMWSMGVDVGSTESYTSSSGAQQNTVGISMTGGRTPLHDDCELIANTPEPTDTGATIPGYKEKLIIVHQSGETAVQVKDCGYVRIARGTSGSGQRNFARNDYQRIVAISYSYPEAATEMTRIQNYVVLVITMEQTKDYTSGNEQTAYAREGYWYLNLAYLNSSQGLNMYLDEDDRPDPDEDPFDPSDQDPYDPDPDDTSDLIDIPTDPAIGISNAGWVHVYNPTTGGLVNFGAWLFPNPELPSTADPTEIVNYLLLLCQTLANSRLIDYVLDCHIIPVSPQVTAAQDIKVGGRTAVGISAPVVASDYITVSCGALNIQEYFGGFQDFLLTKSHLYLPFVGFVDVLPEYWQSGTISVDYKFNVIDGSFMAYVRSASNRSQLAGSVIAQYSGNACMHIPITGINYANMVSGLVGAAVAAQSGKGASAVLGQAYSAANTILSGGDMVQSNGYNSTAAMLGVRYPYLVIERPVPSYPSQYAHSKGFPSNIYTQLSGISGYTIIDDIDLSGIPLMEVELNELRTLLKEGVYF